MTDRSLPGFPIRKSMDQRLFAPTHGLSQLITSFIACKSLGIHHTPFLTCSQRLLSRCALIGKLYFFSVSFAHACLCFLFSDS